MMMRVLHFSKVVIMMPATVVMKMVCSATLEKKNLYLE